MYSLNSGSLLQGGKYRIERVLGQGSFGITYLATTKLTMMGELGRMETTVNVAIKEFFMRDINGRTGTNVTSGSNGGIYDDYKRKFKREALNLSTLQHPNIIKVIESFEANNTVYYVMEYIDGGSLDDYILKEDGLKEDEAKMIALQIGSALSYMHSRGMLHLDLKPSNIMRKKSGEIVLIDFGLSKQYTDKGEPESSTKVGAGTIGYAPIEQANYREGNGFPVTMDVYALGATLFKMLTGVRPPEASDILNDGFPFYELQDKNVSDSLSACVAKAMAPLKKDRYQTAEDFINALQKASLFVDEEKIKVKYKEKHRSKQRNPNPKGPDFVTGRRYDILRPRKDTGLVMLEYYPSFRSGETERIYEISSHNFRSLGKGKMYEISISQDNFKCFLTELEQLNIKFYPEITEREEYGTDNNRIKITLFDKNGKKYQTLRKYSWTDEYGGGGNGNLTETPEELFEKILKILPHRLKTVDETETEENSLMVRSDTSQVFISYSPWSLVVPGENPGSFTATVYSDNTVNQLPKTSVTETGHYQVSLPKDQFKAFLRSLETLQLRIREEQKNEEAPTGEQPDKLKILLSDGNNRLYLWLDGLGNGNVVGNIDAIKKQLIQIVPGLNGFLNKGTSGENHSSKQGEKEETGCVIATLGLLSMGLHAFYPLIWLWTLLSDSFKYPNVGSLLLLWVVGVIVSVVVISNKKNKNANVDVIVMWILLVVETAIIYFINY